VHQNRPAALLLLPSARKTRKRALAPGGFYKHNTYPNVNSGQSRPTRLEPSLAMPMEPAGIERGNGEIKFDSDARKSAAIA